MPQINGREYQLATVDFTLTATGATPYTLSGFTAFNYKTGRPVNFVRDHKGTQKGHTIGDEDTSGPNITVWMSEWEAMMAWFVAAYPNRLLQSVSFNATVSYGEDEAGTLKTDELEGVFFLEEARSASADQSAISMPIPLAIKHVYMNGRRPVY